MDTRYTPEQAELRRTARELAREFGPASVADLDDSARRERLPRHRLIAHRPVREEDRPSRGDREAERRGESGAHTQRAEYPGDRGDDR